MTRPKSRSRAPTGSSRSSTTPTRTPTTRSAEEKFKDLGQAYAVLSDAGKRAQYDQQLKYGRPRRGSAAMPGAGLRRRRLRGVDLGRRDPAALRRPLRRRRRGGFGGGGFRDVGGGAHGEGPFGPFGHAGRMQRRGPRHRGLGAGPVPAGDARRLDRGDPARLERAADALREASPREPSTARRCACAARAVPGPTAARRAISSSRVNVTPDAIFRRQRRRPRGGSAGAGAHRGAGRQGDGAHAARRRRAR